MRSALLLLLVSLHAEDLLARLACLLLAPAMLTRPATD